MNKNSWLVKEAIVEDTERWLDFVSKVREDFYGLDLVNDEKFRFGMIKNMKRGTAIYVEDNSKSDIPIIGAMTYSLNQNHISWLAVDSNYRNNGVASSLMAYILCQMFNAKEIKVKTFLYDDRYGKAARSFYKKHGFVGNDILLNEKEFPHPVQVFVKNLE